ncbi:MAG: rhomboid family intramembrane serine protease [Dysgonamonadaceae bacterium]|jgi:membrane associated rhomboid family serine protease|nr:rhomboid family intramembrane serine protease [Dysgonamonadaceae bacterium]
MATIFSDIGNFLRRQSVLSSLLIINVLVFLLIQLVSLFFFLFKLSPDPFFEFFQLPASPVQLLHRPWTVFTYMFTHFDVWHIVFNLLCLYWFGQIFLRFFGPKQLGGLYVLGGIVGGLFFILSYNIFPYFLESVNTSSLIGASASAMAIIFAAAFYRKDLKINIILLGNVKLLYIALLFLVIDLLSIEHDNPGGHIAHIGGAWMGIGFAQAAIKGRDLTEGINSIIDRMANWFAKKPRKTTRQQVYRRPETDYEYNKRKHDEQVEIDRILDKIKRSGYNSLSKNEKKKLFDASK